MIRMTRQPSNRDPEQSEVHHYFHSNYHRITVDKPLTGWFCFGRRENEITHLYEGRDIKSFVHLAINTMNGVNQGDEYYFGYLYQEIPMDDVWRHKRKRPRRVTRAEHERRIAQHRAEQIEIIRRYVVGQANVKL